MTVLTALLEVGKLVARPSVFIFGLLGVVVAYSLARITEALAELTLWVANTAVPTVHNGILSYTDELAIINAFVPLVFLWALVVAVSAFVIGYAIFRWVIRFIPTVG